VFLGRDIAAERERAMTVAYTGLWQLRELAPEAETAEDEATRISLRRRLDQTRNEDRDALRPAPRKRPVSVESVTKQMPSHLGR
jgi:hypothetical protein